MGPGNGTLQGGSAELMRGLRDHSQRGGAQPVLRKGECLVSGIGDDGTECGEIYLFN